MVTLTLLAFIGLVWLREQILHGGGPEWLENEFEDQAQARLGQQGNGALNNNEQVEVILILFEF